MKLHIQHQCQCYATLFAIYAPALQADEKNVMIFYADLTSTAIVSIPNDKLIILDDFNVCIVGNWSLWHW